MYYFTLPGYGGSSAEHWQSHFEQTLPNCERIEQANWDEPNCDSWVKNVEAKIAACKDPEIILIAHSLGCITTVQWAKHFHKKVKAALLVAPPDLENQDHGFGSFTPTPLEKLPFPTILVASDNDPWCKKEQSEFLAAQWGSHLVVINQAGHINADAGFGEWKQGLALVEELSFPT